MTTLSKLRSASRRIHEEVCDIHLDHSVMRNGICDECADDYHEAQILARPSNPVTSRA